MLEQNAPQINKRERISLNDIKPDEAVKPVMPVLPEGREEKIKFLDREIKRVLEVKKNIANTQRVYGNSISEDSVAGEEGILVHEDVEGMQALHDKLIKEKQEEHKNKGGFLKKIFNWRS